MTAMARPAAAPDVAEPLRASSSRDARAISARAVRLNPVDLCPPSHYKPAQLAAFAAVIVFLSRLKIASSGMDFIRRSNA
jgi:hypothetical protein